MRDMTRENLFERWLEEVRAAGPYDDYETFSHFSERITERLTVSDTVTGDAEVLPASEKRDELPTDSEGSTNPGNADPRTQVLQRTETNEPTQGKTGNRDAQITREGTG